MTSAQIFSRSTLSRPPSKFNPTKFMPPHRRASMNNASSFSAPGRGRDDGLMVSTHRLPKISSAKVTAQTRLNEIAAFQEAAARETLLRLFLSPECRLFSNDSCEITVEDGGLDEFVGHCRGIGPASRLVKKFMRMGLTFGSWASFVEAAISEISKSSVKLPQTNSFASLASIRRQNGGHTNAFVATTASSKSTSSPRSPLNHGGNEGSERSAHGRSGKKGHSRQPSRSGNRSQQGTPNAQHTLRGASGLVSWQEEILAGGSSHRRQPSSSHHARTPSSESGDRQRDLRETPSVYGVRLPDVEELVAPVYHLRSLSYGAAPETGTGATAISTGGLNPGFESLPQVGGEDSFGLSDSNALNDRNASKNEAVKAGPESSMRPQGAVNNASSSSRRPEFERKGSSRATVAAAAAAAATPLDSAPVSVDVVVSCSHLAGFFHSAVVVLGIPNAKTQGGISHSQQKQPQQQQQVIVALTEVVRGSSEPDFAACIKLPPKLYQDDNFLFCIVTSESMLSTDSLRVSIGALLLQQQQQQQQQAPSLQSSSPQALSPRSFGASNSGGVRFLGFVLLAIPDLLSGETFSMPFSSVGPSGSPPTVTSYMSAPNNSSSSGGGSTTQASSSSSSVSGMLHLFPTVAAREMMRKAKIGRFSLASEGGSGGGAGNPDGMRRRTADIDKLRDHLISQKVAPDVVARLPRTLLPLCVRFQSASAAAAAATASASSSANTSSSTAALASPRTQQQLQVSISVDAATTISIPPESAHSAPISIECPWERGRLYTVVLTDPDAPASTAPSLREFVHWVVPNIAGEKGYISAQMDPALKFMGPAPPFNSGPHRYIFLVFLQVEGAKPLAVADVAQFFEGRAQKSTQKFAEKFGLGAPVAAAVFTCQWTPFVDSIHESMGFLPPITFRSPKQLLANPK